MPFVPRLFIRTAFAWFAIGMVWAAVIMLLKVSDREDLRRAFIMAHTHILLVGFFVNAIMGVAFWMFSRPPDRRMNEPPAILAYSLLSAGLTLRVATEWAWEDHRGDVLGVVLGVAGVMQATGGLLFLGVIWPRVRAVRPPPHLMRGTEPEDSSAA